MSSHVRTPNMQGTPASVIKQDPIFKNRNSLKVEIINIFHIWVNYLKGTRLPELRPADNTPEAAEFATAS